MRTTECSSRSRTWTSSKNCQNCGHMQFHSGGNTICNLYRKYTIAAKVLCTDPKTNEFTDWVPKPKEVTPY